MYMYMYICECVCVCVLKTLKRNRVPGEQVTEIELTTGGARGVMVIIAGIGHGDASSNQGRE